MSKDLLLELGTEEIPSRFISSIKSGMQNYLSKKLKELRISYDDIKIKSTPRRFSIFIKNLAENQESTIETVKGPSKKIAYDKNGNMSKALTGFLKSKNAREEDIEIREEKGQEYIYVKVTKPSEKTETYFKNIFEDMVASLVFAKPMKWGQSSVKFIRPIRWVVLLYGDEKVEINLFGLETNNITKGHRFLGSDKIVVDKIENYENLLEENYCILDDEKRKNLIHKQIINVSEKLGGKIIEDEELLDEINYIVEYPTALYGEYDEEYLKLPQEAVITPMKEHQRYFPVLDKNGKLMPYFITVRNGDELGIENVKKGNEKVLEARLADAKFFYEQDTSKKLEDYLPILETIVYHEKLGTMADKKERLMKITEKLAKKMNINEKDSIRAAELSKADLTTSFVNEFTELQGIMGSYYAKESSEKENIVNAIREQYLPKFAGDALPESPYGVALSISDRLDILAGFFAIGIRPTGSVDPYALRRQTIGLINILDGKKLDFMISDLLNIALDIYEEKIKFDREKTFNDLMEFITLRIKNIFLDDKIKYDIVDVVLFGEEKPVFEYRKNAEEISKWLEKDKNDAINAFIRVINIAKDIEYYKINEELFEKEEEKNLYEKFNNIKSEVNKEIDNKEYINALTKIESLVPYIDKYFDSVMINVDDEKTRKNRQSQISIIRDTLFRIADFSKLVIEN